MIYITEGLQIDGQNVKFIHLKDLFEFFNACGCDVNQIVIKDVCLDQGCVLKALPIHIDKNDIPFLKDLSLLQPILNPQVIFKIIATPIHFKNLKELICKTNIQIDLTNITVLLTQEEFRSYKTQLSNFKNTNFQFTDHVQPKNSQSRALWIGFSCINLVIFLYFSYCAFTKEKSIKN